MWSTVWFLLALLGIKCYFVKDSLASNVTVHGCEGKYAWLHCPAGKAIQVTEATYGRTSRDICKHEKDNSTTCAQNASNVTATTNKIKAVCDNRRTCSVLAMNVNFGDTCPGIYKYITVNYNCSDKVCENAYNDSTCQDYAYGSWAKANGSECVNNPIWMYRNCWKSCTRCNADCNNIAADDALCDEFALRGECSLNPHWMYSHCPKACKACPPPTGCRNALGNDTVCSTLAANGDCQNDTLSMFWKCRKACGACHKGCFDFYDEHKPVRRCEGWAKAGECKTNPQWMLIQCAKSCGMCPKVGEKCKNVDGDAECDKKAKEGKCNSDPQSMLVKCKKSCLCFQGDECINTGRPAWHCDSWAKKGECEKNAGWMIPNCRRSCGKCTS